MLLRILLIVLPTLALAQQTHFRPLEAENELSQQHINALLKDHQGFMWIATQDGLNRFDAYQFRTFFQNPGDTNSLSSNYVWTLYEDTRQQLWVGTYGGGLCRYDPNREQFKPFPTPSTLSAANSIRTLIEFPKGTLQVGTDAGLWQFDLEKERYSPLDTTLFKSLTTVLALFPLSETDLLVGTAEGLFLYEPEHHRLQKVDFPLSFTQVSAIQEVENEIWVGGAPGVFRLKKAKPLQVIGHFAPTPLVDANRLSNAITTLLADPYGAVWLGALDGFYQLDLNDFQIRSALPDLPDRQVSSLVAVEPGLLWVGTREGVFQWENTPSKFQLLNRRRYPGLCSEVMLGMAEDAAGNWWIGTKEGLLEFDPKTGGHFCYTPDNSPGMPDPYVLNIRYLNGTLWVGFLRGGIRKFVSEGAGKGRFVSIPGLQEVTQGAGLLDMVVDEAGIYWIATPNKGLLRWDPRTDSLQAFGPASGKANTFSSPYLFHLLLDKNGFIWAGTANGGLCRFDPRTERVTTFANDPQNPNSISSNLVLSTYQDSQGRIWACTANGLNLMTSDSTFLRITKKEGLPNETVYGILEDASGDFWLSTNGGLCKLRLAGNERFTIQAFTQSDGLQGNEFNQYAFLKLRDGRLAFGGTNGLNFFDPLQIQPYNHPSLPVLTDFLLFNQSVPIGAGPGFYLEKSITKTEKITLRHDQNFIAFEFAALGYTQPEHNQFRYRLEGLDEKYVEAGNRRFASYPNLEPGDYRFTVVAGNHDDVWFYQPASVALTVLKPWWQRWWAYSLYGLVLGGILAGIFRSRVQAVRRLERAKAEERELFRKRTARDFHDEAGNRITKLSLLTEVVKRQAPENGQQLLMQIEENIQALRSGMRDFIWVLDPSHDNLHDTLLRLKDFGNDLFEHTPTLFQTAAIPGDLQTVPLNSAQRRHLLMIFKEAMNNAVKYAQAGEALLKVEVQRGVVEVAFLDNGVGLGTNYTIGHGFQNMKERAARMPATLEILSEKGQGVEIRVQFNTTQMGD